MTDSTTGIRPPATGAPGSSGTVADARLEPMGSVDRAWLAMDRPLNPMIVTAILEFDGVRDVEAFGRAVFDRLTRHDRFRQRIDDVRDPRAWRWVEAPDPGYHVQIVRSAGSRGAAVLKASMGAEIGRSLDTAFPLWRVFLYPTSGRRVVLLFRAHHAMADGIALLQLLLRLVDGEATSPGPAMPRPTVAEGPLSGVIDRLSRLNDTWLRARRIERQWWGEGPRRKRMLEPVVEAAAVVGRTLARRGTRPPGLDGALQGHRRLDWSEPLPLSPLRERAHAFDLTLNDLLLAALAGAIGDHLRSIGPVDAGTEVCVSIPVNLRASADRTLGNHFGLVLLDLPAGEENATRRRILVGERMRRLKASMEARATLAALAAVGTFPPAAARFVVDRVASKSCAVVSNLPGPDHVLRFDGARLVRAMFLAPQTGDIGLGISILTYAGRVSLAVCADVGVLGEPSRVLRPFTHELKSLIDAPLRRPRRIAEPRDGPAAAFAA